MPHNNKHTCSIVEDNITVCNKCGKTFSFHGKNGLVLRMKLHLKQVHNITKQTCLDIHEPYMTIDGEDPKQYAKTETLSKK